MSGRNIKVKGHAMVKPDPECPGRWECMCGAWAKVLPPYRPGQTQAQLRRDGHDEHKISVLRSQGKLEEA